MGTWRSQAAASRQKRERRADETRLSGWTTRRSPSRIVLSRLLRQVIASVRVDEGRRHLPRPARPVRARSVFGRLPGWGLAPTLSGSAAVGGGLLGTANGSRLRDQRDPVELLEEQAASRVPELVPLRYGPGVVSSSTTRWSSTAGLAQLALERGDAAVEQRNAAPTGDVGSSTPVCSCAGAASRCRRWQRAPRVSLGLVRGRRREEAPDRFRCVGPSGVGVGATWRAADHARPSRRPSGARASGAAAIRPLAACVGVAVVDLATRGGRGARDIEIAGLGRREAVGGH